MLREPARSNLPNLILPAGPGLHAQSAPGPKSSFSFAGDLGRPKLTRRQRGGIVVGPA